MSVPIAILVVLVGLAVLERAAEEFTEALGGLARRLRASEGTIGLLTAGGEWEELVVVIAGIASGHPAIAAGNIVGACIANLIGSLPLGMLARRPLRPDRSARVYGYVLVGVTVLAAAFAVDGSVGPAAGGVLLAVFAGYVASVVLVVRRGWLEPPREEGEDDDEQRSVWRLALVLVVSLGVISAAAEGIVQGAVVIARHVGLSDYAIGATVVAIGTTLPDKAFSLVGGMRGQSGVVTANALGSNIFILTLLLGIGALASGGLSLAPHIAHVDVPILLGVTLATVALLHRTRLHRGTGLTLLALYVGYIALALLRP